MSEGPKQPVSVLVVIHTPGLEVLVMERAGGTGLWQSVTGSREGDEVPVATALREVAVTDVCPYSLGVDIAERLDNGNIRNGLFAPIIERNIAVPASRVETFGTMANGQNVVEFGIYQGESRMVRDGLV